MANTKSAQKFAKKSLVKREKNKRRKSAIKTAMKKVLDSIERGDDYNSIKLLLQDAESKLARAKTKRLYHRNAVDRKVSRLAKKVSAIAPAAE